MYIIYFTFFSSQMMWFFFIRTIIREHWKTLRSLNVFIHLLPTNIKRYFDTLNCKIAISDAMEGKKKCAIPVTYAHSLCIINQIWIGFGSFLFCFSSHTLCRFRTWIVNYSAQCEWITNKKNDVTIFKIECSNRIERNVRRRKKSENNCSPSMEWIQIKRMILHSLLDFKLI